MSRQWQNVPPGSNRVRCKCDGLDGSESVRCGLCGYWSIVTGSLLLRFWQRAVVLGEVDEAASKLMATWVPRRAGDPAAIVAGADRAREILGWKPQHADLDFIVASALAWERHLEKRNEA